MTPYAAPYSVNVSTFMRAILVGTFAARSFGGRPAHTGSSFWQNGHHGA